MKSLALDVQVSVVNTNNRVLLERCLSSLPNACGGITWQVTVIDNASTDGSVQIVRERFPWASLVENRAREGFSANHNKVVLPLIRERGARYVLILNEDTELGPGSVATLVQWADRDPRIGALGPRIRGPRGEEEQSLFPFPTVLSEARSSLLPRWHRPQSGPERGWLNGSCVLVSVDALAEIGSLDERFFIFFEDTDLGRRLADAGRPSILCDEAVIIHLGHQTVSQRGRPMEQQVLRSRYLFFRKHHSRAEAELVAALVRGGLAVRAAKALVGGFVARNAQEWQLGRLLIQLAQYNPREPLPHERVVPEVSL